MTYLFAFQATQPSDLFATTNLIGPENDRHIIKHASQAGLVIAVWGNDGRFMDRHRAVSNLLPSLHCLKITKGGDPPPTVLGLPAASQKMCADIQHDEWA